MGEVETRVIPPGIPKADYMTFQINHAAYPILNLGCGANPCGFTGPQVTHFDIDRWRYPRMVVGDAHHLPFRDNAFSSTVCGDVFEHLLHPDVCLREMRRVSPKIVLTVFEEWRLPGEGQWVKRSEEISGDLEAGYVPYLQSGSLMERYSEHLMPHGRHINQFTLPGLRRLFRSCGLWVVVQQESCPGYHEGHPMKNWMFVLRRV
jgi:hypothetical protein